MSSALRPSSSTSPPLTCQRLGQRCLILPFKNFMKINNQNELLCAACGYNYTHLISIEAFERAEDAVSGLHVIIEGQSAITNTALDGNPSDRRDAVRLTYSCEGCDKLTVISFIQHKGNTFVEYGIQV